MWIVCKAGFFNIVRQDGDFEKGLLTVKARSVRDLEDLGDFIPYVGVEESFTADYRYRIKAAKELVRGGFATILNEIDYPKTKVMLAQVRPERQKIHLDVWDTLYEIQEPKK